MTTEEALIVAHILLARARSLRRTAERIVANRHSWSAQMPVMIAEGWLLEAKLLETASAGLREYARLMTDIVSG